MPTLIDRFRGFNRSRKIKKRLNRPAQKTPLGFLFNGPKPMQEGVFEVEETKIIQAILSHSNIFVNVGANIGYYCCIAQMHNVKTYAFEPIPNNVTCLQKNIRQNGWGENISILPVAVGETSGVVDIYGEGTGASIIEGWAGNPMSMIKQVPVVRMDDIITTKVNEDMFVLMDVEGFELFALRGGTSLINAPQKPVWLMEINLDFHQPKGVSTNPNFAETFKILMDADYNVYEANSGLRQIGWDEIKSASDGGPHDITAHNFLFLDKTRRIQDVILMVG